MKTNSKLNSWEISQGDYNSIFEYEKAFDTVRKKEKLINSTMLTLFFLGGIAFIFLVSFLVGQI